MLIIKLKKLIYKVFLILIINLFLSCNFIYQKIYQKCDYCNLSYKSEEIFISDNYENSYHKNCYDIYFVANKNNKNKIRNPSQIIYKDTDTKPYFNDIRKQLIEIGIDVREDVKIRVLDRNEVTDICKNYRAAGCAMGNIIVIQKGFHETVFKGILAHELTHVWQFQNRMIGSITAINREGLAELVKGHVVKMDTTIYHYRKDFIPEFYHRPRSIRIPKHRKPYVIGYRKMKRYLDANGWEKLVDGYSLYFK